MPIEEQLEAIFEVLEGGVETTAEVIQFPTDVAGAGATLEGTTTEVMLGNGVATEVSQLTTVEAGVTETAGVGLLALSVPEIAVAIGCCLGIAGGVALYELNPEFWTNVSNKLLEAHQTVGGKVLAFINGDTKQIGVSEETLEIFKEAFIEAGIFAEDISFPDITNNISMTISGDRYNISNDTYNAINKNYVPFAGRVSSISQDSVVEASELIITYNDTKYHMTPNVILTGWYNDTVADTYKFVDLTQLAETLGLNERFRVGYRFLDKDGHIIEGSSTTVDKCILNGITKYIFFTTSGWGSELNPNLYNYFKKFLNNGRFTSGQWKVGYPSFFNMKNDNPNLQPDAKYPNAKPIPEIYPSWTPWSVPVEGFPDVYPIECPAINDNPDQSEAQNPSALPDDNPDLLPWLIETLPQPKPNPDPYPEPAPNPDPDPQPEPEPIPDPEPEPTPENPVDPNPDPTPSPLPVVPVMPDTVPANAMFTVYAPTISQVNSFGGWLWDSNILEQIKRIWQDPLNGIISFMKVYATPTTGGSDTIKVGVLDSNVSSAVVTSQFVTIDCGSINISEKFYNATDYTPFVSLHLYLPFIGIVELDVDEFMNGTITVTYHVDVYTGTCLAEVKSTRSPDMPNPTIVYTFSGNASQQLPLTSAEFSGALSSLVSAVGGGLAIASGGGLGLLAGATGIAHAVTHEMVHVAHSGSLSANAGIMGSRTPFIIITRHRPYDANGYNTIWGYPSNKTVYLNNCSGLVRVKDMQIKTGATRGENDEIMELLKNGVII